MPSRQPQTRFHGEATKSTAQWPTPTGRRWSLTCCVFVIVIASHVAGANEKRPGSSPNEYPGHETTTKFKVHSIRKSFLSALYGIAVADGEIKLDDALKQLGTDDNEPSLTPEEKQARVIDLLKARSGIYHAALDETPASKA